MASDLAKVAKDRGIKYFMISFTDLFGGQRAKLVPAAAIADMQKDGAGFAGFATWLDMTPGASGSLRHAGSGIGDPAPLEEGGCLGRRRRHHGRRGGRSRRRARF